jgi:hypothetical protein
VDACPARRKLNTVDAEQLGLWLEHQLPRMSTLHLTPRNTRVAHILNWGGFVNHSFSVSDGTVQYHLKLTNDLDSIARLQRSRLVHDALEKRYRAPIRRSDSLDCCSSICRAELRISTVIVPWSSNSSHWPMVFTRTKIFGFTSKVGIGQDVFGSLR